MALEYEDLTIEAAVVNETLNARAEDGWRVHTAFSPTHFLLERGSATTTAQPAKAPGSPYR